MADYWWVVWLCVMLALYSNSRLTWKKPTPMWEGLPLDVRGRIAENIMRTRKENNCGNTVTIASGCHSFDIEMEFQDDNR